MQHEITFRKGNMHLFKAMSKFLISELDSYEVKVGSFLLFDGDSVDFGDGHIRSCPRLKSAIRVGFLVLEKENYSTIHEINNTTFHADTQNAGVRTAVPAPPSYLLPVDVAHHTVLKEKIMTEAELLQVNQNNKNLGFDPTKMGFEFRDNGDGRVPFSQVEKPPTVYQKQGTAPMDPQNVRIQEQNNTDEIKILGKVRDFANKLPPGVTLAQVSGGNESDYGSGVTLGSIESFKLENGQIPSYQTRTASQGTTAERSLSGFAGRGPVSNDAVEATRQARLASVETMVATAQSVKPNRLELTPGLSYDLDAPLSAKLSLIKNVFSTNIDILNIILNNEFDPEVVSVIEKLIELYMQDVKTQVSPELEDKPEKMKRNKAKPRTRKLKKDSDLSAS